MFKFYVSLKNINCAFVKRNFTTPLSYFSDYRMVYNFGVTEPTVDLDSH